MRLIDVFRISVRMLRTNLLRSLLTVLGIGVAISFIVVLIGFGYGLQSLTIGSIVRSKALLSLDVQSDLKQNTALTPQTILDINKLEGVENSSPVIITAGQLTIDTKVAAVAVTAANDKYLEMEGIEIRAGQSFKDGAREMVISPQTLDLLNVGADTIIGKAVNLSYTDPDNENELKHIENILVVGLSGPTEAPALFVPVDLLSPTGAVKLTSIKVVAKDRPSILSIRSALSNQGYQVESLIDTLDQARRVFRYANLGLAGFGGIALVVASIGMFNTLTIALIERTREIGIMKAIGVTDTAVKQLFLAEAGIIGFMGGLFGIAIGLAFDKVLEFILNQYAKSFQAEAIPLFQYPVGFLIGMLIFPIVLSMVTGLYPAIRASKLNPLKALRYE